MTFSSPREAIDHGIGMVHQHFMLIPVMTVAENVVLGTEPRDKGVFLDYGAARARVRDLSASFGFAIDTDARVADITVGQQQRVEILKALYRRADILILDEPTAVLTPQEATELFAILKGLVREGMSIIFISHKLGEVLDIADRVTVIRRGKVIETLPTAGATEESLAQLMVGREVLLEVEKTTCLAGRPAPPGRRSPRSRRARHREGARRLAGGPRRRDRRYRGGRRQRTDGAHRRDRGPSPSGRRNDRARRGGCDTRRSAGTTSTPASGTSRRTGSAGVSCWTSRSRRTSHSTTTASHRRHVSAGSSRTVSSNGRDGLITEFDVRGGGPLTKASALSGGNQQKVILAREIDRDPKVLIAAQPTRGLDVGAIEFVHRRLIEERDDGRAVLLVSLELDEILSLSDRILVMYEGEIVGSSRPTVDGGGARARDDRRWKGAGSVTERSPAAGRNRAGRRPRTSPSATGSSRRREDSSPRC